MSVLESEHELQNSKWKIYTWSKVAPYEHTEQKTMSRGNQVKAPSEHQWWLLDINHNLINS